MMEKKPDKFEQHEGDTQSTSESSSTAESQQVDLHSARGEGWDPTAKKSQMGNTGNPERSLADARSTSWAPSVDRKSVV